MNPPPDADTQQADNSQQDNGTPKKSPSRRRTAADLLKGMEVPVTAPSSVPPAAAPEPPDVPPPAPETQVERAHVSAPTAKLTISGLTVKVLIWHVPGRLVFVDFGDGSYEAAYGGQEIVHDYEAPGEHEIRLADQAEPEHATVMVVELVEPAAAGLVASLPPKPPSIVYAKRPVARNETLGIRVTTPGNDYYKAWCRAMASAYGAPEKHVTAHVADFLLENLDVVEQRFAAWMRDD